MITPYHAQVRKIRKLLRDADIPEVDVGSVEVFQGQERRAIIISTVRSSADLLAYDAKFTLGFVSNPRRFNGNVYFRQLLLTALRISLFCSRRYARQVTSYRCRESRYAVP